MKEQKKDAAEWQIGTTKIIHEDFVPSLIEAKESLVEGLNSFKRFSFVEKLMFAGAIFFSIKTVYYFYQYIETRSSISEAINLSLCGDSIFYALIFLGIGHTLNVLGKIQRSQK